MKPRRRWRRALRALASTTHLWLGLGLGLVLTLLGLTGSVLVYRAEIDALLEPELHRVEARGEPVTVDALLAAVRQERPDLNPTYVRLPTGPGASAEIWTDGEAGPVVFLDPYDARILGVRHATESFTGWLFALHVDLLAGEAGHWIVGASGFALLVLVLSGLVVWWPRVGQWARRLTVRRGAWRRVNYDLHGASGAWLTAALVVLGVTGASFVFHDAFRTGLNAVTASEAPPPPPRSTPRPGAADAPLQAAVATAAEALPDGRPTWVYLPAAPDAPLAIRVRQPSEWHQNGRSYVYLDRHTGELLHAQDATRAQLGTLLYDVLYPLHVGRFGAWSKALYALLGLAPLLLSVGGTIIWWQRRSPRAAVRARRGTPRAEAAGEAAASRAA